jgi:hypothetical protein
LYGEKSITREYVQNNNTVREMLGKQGIKPEELPRCVIASRKAMKSNATAFSAGNNSLIYINFVN